MEILLAIPCCVTLTKGSQGSDLGMKGPCSPVWQAHNLVQSGVVGSREQVWRR